jgi:hypothetical protein
MVGRGVLWALGFVILGIFILVSFFTFLVLVRMVLIGMTPSSEVHGFWSRFAWMIPHTLLYEYHGMMDRLRRQRCLLLNSLCEMRRVDIREIELMVPW